jgi:carboxyl-terminal processing protease
VRRNIIFFVVVWLAFGVLGFMLGMHWSIKGEPQEKVQQKIQRKMPRTTLNKLSEGKPQATEITITSDTAQWDAASQMDISMVEKTLQMLKEEYLEETDREKLVKGAIVGMKKGLEEKKLKTEPIKGLAKNAQPPYDVSSLRKIYSTILAHYGGKISESDLTYAALKGLMDALDDPYSVALEPKEYKLLNEQMSGGNYGGIGVYIELSKKNKNMLTIVEPIEGGPAEKAGIKPGDLVVKLDGVSTKGLDLEVAAQKIRGDVGSPIWVTVMRKDTPEKTYKLLREIIHVSSVTHNIKPGNIGYIRVRFFGNETDTEFSQALEKVLSLGAKGLIIDLRNNGGGYISAAIDVCSKLLENGTLIVSVVNPRTGRKEVHKAIGSEQLRLPLVVLVNDLSASASEITAGALKDTNTGILLGEKTFGKGSVQTIHELRDGGALKYTIAKYLTPKGSDINKKGIAPDIEVKMEPAKVDSSEDVQLKEALKYLKKKLDDQ